MNILLGYLVSTIGGAIVLHFVHEWLWQLSKEEPNAKETPATSQKIIKTVLGISDRLIYTTAFIIQKPEFVLFWLAMKIAVTWNRDQSKTYNIFLTLNAISVIFGFLGALIAYGSLTNLMNRNLHTFQPVSGYNRNAAAPKKKTSASRPQTQKQTAPKPKSTPAAAPVQPGTVPQAKELP